MQALPFQGNPILLPMRLRLAGTEWGTITRTTATITKKMVWGDYIPDEDYVEESDPGDTYYWYDGEGNVMYFNGYENLYMGP